MDLRDQIVAVLTREPNTVRVMNDHAIATEVYGREDEEWGAEAQETEAVRVELAAMVKNGTVEAGETLGMQTYWKAPEPAEAA